MGLQDEERFCKRLPALHIKMMLLWFKNLQRSLSVIACSIFITVPLCARSSSITVKGPFVFQSISFLLEDGVWHAGVEEVFLCIINEGPHEQCESSASVLVRRENLLTTRAEVTPPPRVTFFFFFN